MATTSLLWSPTPGPACSCRAPVARMAVVTCHLLTPSVYVSVVGCQEGAAEAMARMLRTFGPLALETLAEQFAAAAAGQHLVVDRAGHAHKLENSPQATRVIFGLARAVPLVQAPVDAVLVVGDPQLRDEPRETGEQRRIEQALPAEQRVPEAAAYGPQPELNHKNARLPRGSGIDHGLAVDPGRRSVREPQPHSGVPAGQMDAAPGEQPGGAADAANHGRPRDRAGQRALTSRGVRAAGRAG